MERAGSVGGRRTRNSWKVVSEVDELNNYILGDLDLLRLSRISSLLWLLLPRLTDRERERLLLLLLLYLE